MWATSLHVRLAPPGDSGNAWSDVDANEPARVDRLNEIIRDVVCGREGGSSTSTPGPTGCRAASSAPTTGPRAAT